MTATNRHEPAAQRGLEAVSGPTAGVTGTTVPRHSDPIHDHWDEAYALGYLRGYADGRDDGRLVGLDAAREAISPLLHEEPCDCDNCRLITTAQALIAALRSQPALLAQSQEPAYQSEQPRDTPTGGNQVTERLSYENGVEVGYERALKAAHEDPNILASYSWSQGYAAGLDAAQEAIRNREDGEYFPWVQVEIALAAINALVKEEKS